MLLAPSVPQPVFHGIEAKRDGNISVVQSHSVSWVPGSSAPGRVKKTRPFALCVGFICWISVSLGAAILIFKPSRENKCRGTAAIWIIEEAQCCYRILSPSPSPPTLYIFPFFSPPSPPSWSLSQKAVWDMCYHSSQSDDPSRPMDGA